MKYQLPICGFLAIALTAASAQMASHTPTAITNTASAQTSPLQVNDKPVARVNGAVLTDRDLLREMYAIFPYAQQHNGFPKAQEAAIRQGALEMIIFEELVYQEAERRAPEAGFVSMAGVFDSVSEPVYVDEVHLGPRGNELVADAIAKYLGEHPAGMEFRRR